MGKKRTKLSREDLIAKYELQPEGLRQEVVEVVEKDKTNLDLYLADIGMIINSTQRLQKMDKKMRQVNLSLLEVEQYYNKQKAPTALHSLEHLLAKSQKTNLFVRIHSESLVHLV